MRTNLYKLTDRRQCEIVKRTVALKTGRPDSDATEELHGPECDSPLLYGTIIISRYNYIINVIIITIIISVMRIK